MAWLSKNQCTIGCCGIDCGLCPRFYTDGDSVCPGCGGENFKSRHPSCGVLACCFFKKGFEVCSECNLYPCNKFEPEKINYDSFVTHKKMLVNLAVIKENGLDSFIPDQKERMMILRGFIRNFDDGRSKSFFCLSCALLPLDKLRDVYNLVLNEAGSHFTLKEKCRILKNKLTSVARDLNISLQLEKK